MPKRDLIFSKPLLNAAGTLGFAPDGRAPVPWQALGAFVTNPLSMRPRKPAAAPALLEFPGGFLLHTGLPNPGFTKVIRRHGRHWKEAPLPVIVNIMADRPEETRQMARALEGMENVVAMELSFAPLLADDIIRLAVEASQGELPLIVSLPSEQLLELGGEVLELGAAALSLAPPRGALPLGDSLVTGRLFGPALFPRSLDLVHSAARFGFPVIASGGVCSFSDVQAMLDAGALAVQMASSLWLPRE